MTALLIEMLLTHLEAAYSSANFAAVKCRIEQRRMFGKHACRCSEKRSVAVMSGRLVRAIVPSGAPVRILIDGAEVAACAGESVLVAVLAARNALRLHEFNGEPRAGFCLMGACQDCWIWLADGRRIRACTTAVAEAMDVSTAAPQDFPRHD
jgi:hypothetical protein